MATDSGGRPLAPEAARAALAGLDDDNARLADRVVTPWWYHPALGVVVAVVALSSALPPSAMAAVIALCVVVLVLLPAAYRRRYGVWVSQPAGPASRAAFRWVMGAIVLGVVGGAALGMIAPVWALAPAVLVLVAVVVLGRRYDEALRRDLAAGPR